MEEEKELLWQNLQPGSDRNRAALQAGLLQQGFGQAQAAAQQNFANQMGLASALPGLQRQDVSTLGSLGALNQAQDKLNLMQQEKQIEWQHSNHKKN